MNDMGMMPETEKNNSDFIDMLITASHRNVKVTNAEGREVTELKLDTKKLDYKTQMVNSPFFSRFVFELEEFANLALDVYNFMTYKRAKVISDQIIRHVASYGYSIDAKSSETLRDHNNSQSSLTHIMTRNHMEKSVTFKEELKKGMWESFKGKEKDKEVAQS